MVSELTERLATCGMSLRGGFIVESEDGVPGLPDGRRARTLLLLGNIGGSMWPAFAAAEQPGPDPMDGWTRNVLAPVAAAMGAHALYPADGPPYLPFQRWAERAEPVFRSPLGILIHPTYGLWHAYRAALVFADEVDFPRHADATNPCTACASRPCLSACPVGAFSGASFDAADCARHADGPDGADCSGGGCLARRACPVGRDFTYPSEQLAFHMEAFLARRRPNIGLSQSD